MAGYTAEALQHEADLLAVMPRPKAPASYRLTKEENEEWNRIVEAMPANWFAPENFGVLAVHVTAIVQARDLADMIKECKKAKDWVNVRYLTIEQRKLNDQVKKFAARLKLMSRANEATRKHELKIRRDMERRIPTIQHASPWDNRSAHASKAEPSVSPWDRRGAAKEAAG